MAQRCLPPTTARAGYVVFGELGDEDGGRLAAEGELGSYVIGLETTDIAGGAGDGTEDTDCPTPVVQPPGL